MPGGQQGLIKRLIRMLGFDCPDLRDDLIAASRFHRIIRRGREFGAYLPPGAAARLDCADPECGLYFVCLNANIARQFEFVQTAWVASTKFGGLTQESDPLLGNRQPIAGCPITGTFSLPQPSGAGLRLRDVPQFVTVCGGAYFFLPSLSALRYLASLGE